eukprot:TRINITY_DN3445_c0_g1_i2.p1 TRINITY_DN3445_c0_g1~~TRINITY_DN3445_c0_g1_i2.p1  ORF type:complete len:207 (+),score=51.14 TRINITY_DN3445_c0_g1_i2:121-741(+)
MGERVRVACFRAKELAFSFNGGKDSTVLLHLIRAVWKEKGTPLSELGSFYIEEDDSFEEITSFVKECSREYGLSLNVCTGVKFKECLKHLVQSTEIRAVFTGTRQNDPSGEKLTEFAPADPDWPPLMRVNPLLCWRYSDVWEFLRVYGFRYASLYDAGYTSVGLKANTQKNPVLRQKDGTFLPAWMLKDESMERVGRGVIVPQPQD